MTTASRVVAILLSLTLATGCAAAAEKQEFAAQDRVLTASTDRDDLESTATALAKSGKPEAIALLGKHLKDPAFLARLDDLAQPQLKTRRLQRVFAALAANPSPAVASLCLELRESKSFMADDDRRPFLLTASAAVRPMEEATVRLFVESNEAGYFSFNAPLLVANGSPPALGLFKSMILNEDVPAERRVDALHASLPMHRTSPATLDLAGKLLESDPEAALSHAVLESLFDFRGREWFGPHFSEPPEWKTAPPAAADKARGLARAALKRPDLPGPLRTAIEATLAVLPAAP
jgi:hypothetical protein